MESVNSVAQQALRTLGFLLMMISWPVTGFSAPWLIGHGAPEPDRVSSDEAGVGPASVVGARGFFQADRQAPERLWIGAAESRSSSGTDSSTGLPSHIGMPADPTSRTNALPISEAGLHAHSCAGCFSTRNTCASLFGRFRYQITSLMANRQCLIATVGGRAGLDQVIRIDSPRDYRRPVA